jgi:hypothetical protein
VSTENSTEDSSASWGNGRETTTSTLWWPSERSVSVTVASPKSPAVKVSGRPSRVTTRSSSDRPVEISRVGSDSSAPSTAPSTIPETLSSPLPVSPTYVPVASYVFYGAWDWRFVPLLMISTVGNEIAAMGIHLARDRQARDRWLTGALVGNLGLLAWWKYAGFLTGSADGLLRLLGFDVELPYPEIVLPVGISFFTFQAISYVVDVHRRTVRPTHLLDVAVYLAFFPSWSPGRSSEPTSSSPSWRPARIPRGVPVGGHCG